MTVEELIRELQAMPPHLPVHIVPARCSVMGSEGEYDVYFEDDCAVVSDDVSFQGAFVLIRGRE